MSLEAELLSVEGVAEAKVDLQTAGPIGLKISILPGADSDMIAQHVSAVLASRGLRSTVAPLLSQDDGPSTIVAGQEHSQRPSDEEPTLRLSIPRRPEARPPNSRGDLGDRGSVGSSETEKARSPLRPATDVPSTDDKVRAPGVTVATAAVSESAKGVELALRMSDGRRVTRRTLANPRSVAQGVVNALASLLDDTEDPVLLLDLDRKSVEGTVVVTVVVKANGAIGVGSAKEFATEILSVARAAWKALADRAAI